MYLRLQQSPGRGLAEAGSPQPTWLPSSRVAAAGTRMGPEARPRFRLPPPQPKAAPARSLSQSLTAFLNRLPSRLRASSGASRSQSACAAHSLSQSDGEALSPPAPPVGTRGAAANGSGARRARLPLASPPGQSWLGAQLHILPLLLPLPFQSRLR